MQKDKHDNLLGKNFRKLLEIFLIWSIKKVKKYKNNNKIIIIIKKISLLNN